MKTVVILAVSVATVISCVKPNGSRGEGELRGAIAAYRLALNAQDSASFFAFFAPDAEVFAPGSQPVRGAGVRDLFRPLFTEIKPELAPFTNEEVTLSGNLGMQRYSFQLTTTPRAGGPATTETGSGLHIWRRMPNGRWQILKDIWTSPTQS